EGLQLLSNAFEWLLQIDLDVITQRLQRRYVNNVSCVVELSLNAESNEIVDGREKRSERLAGPGGSCNERMLVTLDRRPCLCLRRRRRRKLLSKPVSDRWMKNSGFHGFGHYT